MKRLMELGNRFAKQSTWKDLARIAACLFSLGTIFGMFVHEKSKSLGEVLACVALLVYFVTDFPLVDKAVDLFFAMRSEQKEAESGKEK